MMMNIFQTNWLDFLTWTLVGCMAIALIIRVVTWCVPPTVLNKTKDIFRLPQTLRKAS